MALLREQEVVFQFSRQCLPHFDTFVVERDPFRRAIVRAQYGSVTAAVATTQVGSVEHSNAADATLAKVVRDRQPVDSGPYNDNIVPALHVALAPPHSLSAKQPTHRVPPQRSTNFLLPSQTVLSRIHALLKAHIPIRTHQSRAR